MNKNCERNYQIDGPLHESFSLYQETERPDVHYAGGPVLKDMDPIDEDVLYRRWELRLKVETPAEVVANFKSNQTLV